MADAQQEAAERADAVSEKFSKLSGGLNQVTNAAIGITLVAGTLVESFDFLDENAKRQTQAAINAASAFIGITAQVGSLALEITGQLTSSAILRASQGKLAGSAGAASTALDKLTGSAVVGGKSEGGGVKSRAATSAVAAAAAIGVVVAGIKAYTAYLSEGLKIQIENSNKIADKELERLEGGKGGSESKFVAARKTAATKGLEEAELQGKSSNAVKGAIGGGVAGLVAAGVALQAIPGIGTAIGAALLGAAAGAVLYSAVMNQSAKEQEENSRLAAKASREASEVQFRSVKVVKDFQQAMKDAGDAGATAAEKVSLLGGFVDTSVEQLDQNQGKLASSKASRAELVSRLKEQGVVSESGDITASDDELSSDADLNNKVKQLKELNKQITAAEQASADLSQKLIGELNNAQILGKQAISESITELNKFGPEALSTVSSVSDLAGKFPGLNKSIKQTEDTIRTLVAKSFEAQIQGAKDQGDEQLAAALVEQEAATLAKALADQKKSQVELIVTQQKLALSTALADNALRQQALTLLKVNKSLSAFNLFLLQSASVGDIFGEITDAGSEGKLGAVQFDTTIFDVPFEQLNKKAINRINSLGKGVIGKDAEGFAKSISQVKSVTDELPSIFSNFSRQTAEGELINVTELNDLLTAEIGRAVPGGFASLGPDVKAIIKKNVSSSIGAEKIGGGLSVENQQKLTEELKESIKGQIAAFKRGVELQNQYLSKQSEINGKISDAQNTLIGSLVSVSDVLERNAERFANAIGKPRSGKDREQARLRSANIALGPQALRSGARAGDVAATAKAFQDLTKESKRLRQVERDLAKDSKKFAEDAQKNTDAIAKANKASNDAANAAARAKGELERLADQSARAADIEKDLSELRSRRGEAETLQENVAFGSDDQRQEIFRGFRLLNQAFAQGGIQGANSEQRALIKSTLDSVGSQLINFEGQQVTGKELKQIFSARETGRLGLGGLNNFIEDLRRAENPLLADLKDLAAQEFAASIALAAINKNQLDTLTEIKDRLEFAFPGELDAAKADAQDTAGGFEKEQSDVIERNNTIISNLETSLSTLSPVLTSLEAALTKSTEVLNNTIQDVQGLKNSQRDRLSAGGKSKGGPVYFNDGGVVPGSAPTPKGMEGVFKPKGTDTVPAMLQKGEFVIKKSSVDKIGTDALQQINSGGTAYAAKGGVAYLDKGGDPLVEYINKDREFWEEQAKEIVTNVASKNNISGQEAIESGLAMEQLRLEAGASFFSEEANKNDGLGLAGKTLRDIQIADKSIYEEKAYRAGYRTKDQFASLPGDDPLNPTGITREQFLANKDAAKEEAEKARKLKADAANSEDKMGREFDVISRLGTDKQKLEFGVITQEEIDSRKPDSTSEFQQYSQTIGESTRVTTPEITGTDFSPIDSSKSEQAVAEQQKKQKQTEEEKRKNLEGSQKAFIENQEARKKAGIFNINDEYEGRTLESFGPSRGQLTQTDTDVGKTVSNNAILDESRSFPKAPVTPSAGEGKKDLIGILSNGEKIYADEPEETFNIPGYVRNLETGLYEKVETGVDTTTTYRGPGSGERGVQSASGKALYQTETINNTTDAASRFIIDGTLPQARRERIKGVGFNNTAGQRGRDLEKTPFGTKSGPYRDPKTGAIYGSEAKYLEAISEKKAKKAKEAASKEAAERAAFSAGIQSTLKASQRKEDQKAEKERYKQEYYKENNIPADAPASIEKEVAEKYAERKFQARIRLEAKNRKKERESFIATKKAGFEGDIEAWRRARDLGTLTPAEALAATGPEEPAAPAAPA
ncbi:MAG: hypothetical protein GY915_02215, partial [bacterium]|nr:hypothetical protein [bacterium]